jgi:hypothetical protein
MPGQEEHDKPENLVERSTELEKRAARSLEEAADSNATLEGFFAINDIKDSEELEEEVTQDRDKPEDREKGHPIP